MLKASKRIFYFNYIFGTIGNVLLAFVVMEVLVSELGTLSFAIVLFGYTLSIGYIRYLEEKAGVSKKHIWIRISILLASLILAYFYFFYTEMV